MSNFITVHHNFNILQLNDLLKSTNFKIIQLCLLPDISSAAVTDIFRSLSNAEANESTSAIHRSPEDVCHSCRSNFTSRQGHEYISTTVIMQSFNAKVKVTCVLPNTIIST